MILHSVLTTTKLGLRGIQKVSQSKIIFLGKFTCPIILNFKDTIHKFVSSPYTILNKMEENFEQKLKSIGKKTLTKGCPRKPSQT